MRGGGGALPPPRFIQVFGVALVLCYVAVARIRGGRTQAKGRKQRRTSTLKTLLIQRKERQLTGLSGACCEGLVDLIRESEPLPAPLPRQEVLSTSMTLEELAHSILVVVVVGPGSTKVHQGYVVTKLLRYLRWSNLVSKLFSAVEDDRSPHEVNHPNLGKYLLKGEGDGADEPRERPSVTADRPTNGLTNGNGHGGPNDGGRTDDGASAPAKGVTIGGLDRISDSARKSHPRSSFSERGKAAALATIAVQESAKKVADWLNALSSGGVAVVEAGGTGWASSRRGRDTLRDRLRQATTPDLGILWVELLPSGLSHKGAEAEASTAGGAGTGAWKSANGLPCTPHGPGEHVVDIFLRSGYLVGAGGHVFYESLRGGSQVPSTGVTSTSCFVSLADEGADVRRQLGERACPLARRVGNFAAALKIKQAWQGCPVFLTRHGESLMNQNKTMGGDTRLSVAGDHYAGVLADFVAAQSDAAESRLSVWCSPMRRAVQTARAIKCQRYAQLQALTELNTGAFNGRSYKQAEREFPEEFAAREKDKLLYRYPEGESYLDVVNRLDPVVVALEKQDGPVMIISHQAVLRCLYAYFLEAPLRLMPRVAIELHTVVKLTPCDDHRGGTSRWEETRLALIKPTPLEQLAGGMATMGGLSHGNISQLGERLS